MNKATRRCLTAIASVCIFASGAGAANAVSALIGVSAYKQEQSNWCWVATSKSVVRWETSQTISQCTLYKWGKGGSTCPNNTGHVGNVASIFIEAGMNPGVNKTGTVAYSEIQDQIARLGHPVMADEDGHLQETLRDTCW